MNYRREIDGLRALAVLPVILFHAGFHTFSGGYIGVDVFFVISGYLITSIILLELEQKNFSILSFYERRARRILPALFLIMGASSVAAYFWMMPDEFKNFGQSLVATTLFSNNLLLAITSGYWELASEFKPLLHTWSLGVEEQYYVFFPVFLIFFWKYLGKNTAIILSIGIATSFLLATWSLKAYETQAFYLLPTRAWEILFGALTAYFLVNDKLNLASNFKDQILSILGLGLIIISIFAFDQNHPSPGPYTLIPVIGSVLIIVFAKKGTAVERILGNRAMVGIGLISYSLYLWHQPLLAFFKIYSKTDPSQAQNAFLIVLSFVLAFLTWKFVETPTRHSTTISRRFFIIGSIFISMLFIGFGLYLNKTYGMPARAFSPEVRIQDMDKRIYNERVFNRKLNDFSNSGKLKILVIGNSFGRDFVNMNSESFDTKKVDIVYRDDLQECILPFKNLIAERLFSSAQIIVFASMSSESCVPQDIAFSKNTGKRLFYLGTKHFGRNLNWLMRVDPKDLPNQYNALPNETWKQEQKIASSVPPENFISLLKPIIKNGEIPITDHSGKLLSTDRAHLTKYGARYFGDYVLMHSAYGELLQNNSSLSDKLAPD